MVKLSFLTLTRTYGPISGWIRSRNQEPKKSSLILQNSTYKSTGEVQNYFLKISLPKGMETFRLEIAQEFSKCFR